MKCTVVIDKGREEEVIIYAKEKSELVDEIAKLASQEELRLIGYKDKDAVRLDLNDVFFFTVEDNKVFAVTEKEKLSLRLRLYQIEEKLSSSFVKINQSCIANIKKIERFSASFSGSLQVRFKNGHIDYVSRRQLKNVKERLGL